MASLEVDEFGDFLGMVGIGGGGEEDNYFGNFVAPPPVVNNVGIDENDDFGNFVAPSPPAPLRNNAGVDDDDDFGNFEEPRNSASLEISDGIYNDGFGTFDASAHAALSYLNMKGHVKKTLSTFYAFDGLVVKRVKMDGPLPSVEIDVEVEGKNNEFGNFEAPPADVVPNTRFNDNDFGNFDNNNNGSANKLSISNAFKGFTLEETNINHPLMPVNHDAEVDSNNNDFGDFENPVNNTPSFSDGVADGFANIDGPA
jgi:hypothetical protein